MTPDEQHKKLAEIRKLPREQLIGWWQALGKYRPVFDGERAALLERAKLLGLTQTGLEAA